MLLLCLAAAHSSAAGPQRNSLAFFQRWSAAFDKPALRVIAEAAQWAKSHPDAQMNVTGAAGLTGRKQANSLLAELRAQVVAD